ncbi:endonuclease/exonuclease/phosphatase family protein [Sphingomonas sp. 1P06PA]|uniref:endonuclease/exonuclease/phosphatase family protein n=1 Tax=Sphingomonas sp. 1P06PA TaxID=554121 RepID=UPI0039A4C942
MITVATYNMRKGIGTDRRRDPARVLDVLREIDADIVTLQEADRRFGARLSALPLDMIEQLTSYRPVAFDIRPGGIGWHGNAILVRRTAEVIERRPLDLPVLEPRGAVMADLRIHGRELRVIGMHLDLSGIFRRRQLRAVIGHVEACARPMPTVMMGDLNEWSPHGGCLRELGGWRIAHTGKSYHSRHPVAALDRIVTSNDVHVVASGVHRTAKSVRASDHLPVWARIELPKN